MSCCGGCGGQNKDQKQKQEQEQKQKQQEQKPVQEQRAVDGRVQTWGGNK
jgi:hypothetical protein